MQLHFYLQQLISRLYSEHDRNWSALAQHIKEKVDDGKTIDRRKLKRIYDGDQTVTFSITELKRFQEYFVKTNMVRLHENFLFRPPGSLLDALHGEKDMTLFHPARYLSEVGTEVTSRWDVRAIEALSRTPEISSLRRSLQDVFHYGKVLTDAASLKERLQGESWYRMLDEEKALITIGSPFVCYATEEILCRIFEIDPFEPQTLNARRRLPFYLYWPEKHRSSNSAFSLSKEELQEHFPEKAARMKANTRAVLVGHELHLAESIGDSLNVVVAQYWKGHLVLVLLGIYAPGTLAIAECVSERRIRSLGPYRLRRPKSGGQPEPQPILITFIKTTMTDPRSQPGEKRDHREAQSGEMVSWQLVQTAPKQYKVLDQGTYAEKQQQDPAPEGPAD